MVHGAWRIAHRASRIAYPSLSHDIIPSDFFLFGWLKDEFAS
jgi:hypothetical protein